MVNGYKLPFTSSCNAQNEHIYESGTTVNHIEAVKRFDDELRLVLFRQIVRIEEEIRTIAGYQFDIVNDEGRIDWFETNAYDTTRIDKKSIAETISALLGDVRHSKNEYLIHYKKNHNLVPTWILVKVIKFSNFIDLLYKSKRQVNNKICDLYGINFPNGNRHYTLLNGSLQYIRKIRNACAHSERVFDVTTPGNINSSYFQYLPRSYRRNREGYKRLIDLIVYFRYYLDDASYFLFIDEIYNLLDELQSNISVTAYDFIRGKMGIRDKEHLLILKTISKVIDFSTLY